jgi:peptidoglycan hydrolase-like protein with peptidoglycan-binding domain
MTRALVCATAVVGLGAGSLAGASVGFAASQPAAKPAVSTQDVSILAVNNLGLNTKQAKHWQCWVKSGGFDPGTIDGQLGSNSWKATQRYFNHYGFNVGSKLVVDGVVGTNTIKALQNFLGADIDGVAGPQTRSLFASWNNTDWCSV